MKKFMSISLAVVLVLALGSMAFADPIPCEEGTLKNAQLTVTVPVSAEVGPYAKICVERGVNFGTLLGKTGIYTANGFDYNDDGEPLEHETDPNKYEFYQRAGLLFGDSDVNFFDLFVNNKDGGWGIFNIQSNTDVDVAMSFENNGWLTSPTLFGVSRYIDTVKDVKAWASNTSGDDYINELQTSFTHKFDDQVSGQLVGSECKGLKYGIDGAIWIQCISQQLAKEYNSLITLTLSVATDTEL